MKSSGGESVKLRTVKNLDLPFRTERMSITWIVTLHRPRCAFAHFFTTEMTLH